MFKNYVRASKAYQAEIESATRETQEASLALATSQEQLSFALEATGDGIWDWDVEKGRVLTIKDGVKC